jgi:hypothetical protein
LPEPRFQKTAPGLTEAINSIFYEEQIRPHKSRNSSKFLSKNELSRRISLLCQFQFQIGNCFDFASRLIYRLLSQLLIYGALWAIVDGSSSLSPRNPTK